ncbi:ABC transporter permease subunit [Amycolatopsis keratiniphila]|uniref:ABC transporter permease subunit n=1 Tax=Amycolatopsis keratiniphila TaxID=129921 RepID=UPI00087D1103|nr:ABC transporter permease subunit [Amycolatopsis keratiniphila]OLZ58506.1 hypothetical protein BS330_11730 [Amycolatopsis keratiniphila subsp. nogabecina]SDU00443.1 peptide/nickel transport system permease protein [Amycolatopsis keratiniphila]
MKTGWFTAAALAVVTLAGGLLAPRDPAAVSGAPFTPPGLGHLLGTDVLGRDVLSRSLAGGAGLVLLAAAAGAITCVLGVAGGLVAGWNDGLPGRLITGLADVLVALPLLLVALVLAVAVPGPVAVVVATVCGGAPLTTQIVRDTTRRTRAAGWADAARGRGEHTAVLLVREMAPAMAGLIVAEAGLRFVLGLQLACTMTLLGFGAQPPEPDWALMLRENLPGAAENPAAVATPALLLAALACLVTWALRARRREPVTA